jgi:hypothetical protein
MSRVPQVLIAVVLGASCGSGGSLPPSPRPDARVPTSSPDAAAPDAAAPDTAAPDAAPALGPPSPVTGSESGRWLNGGPETVVPLDHTNTKVAVWSKASGSWSYFPGKGGSDGSLTVPDVPAGPFVLTFFRNFLASSTNRSFQLDFFRMGRPVHPSPTIRPTTLILDVSGLQAWQATDRIEYFAPNAPSADWGMQAHLVPALVPGATAVQASVDWGNLGWNALIDGPGKADVAWFVQLSSSPGDQGVIYRTATKALISNSVKVVDGQPVTVLGTMIDLPQTEPIDVELPLPEYAALAPAISPVAGGMNGYYEVLTFPGAAQVGYDTGAAVLFNLVITAQTPALKIKTSYGLPYPESWGRIANVRLYFNVPVLIPGVSTPVQVTAVVHASDDVAHLAQGKAGTFVTPVRAPKLNGQSAFVEQPHATATPTISWDAPSTGKPNLYMVDVLHARVSGGKAVMESVASLYTDETHFDIPPDVLQFGESYVLRITPVVGEGLSVTNPWKWPVRIGWAQCVTARFSP